MKTTFFILVFVSTALFSTTIFGQTNGKNVNYVQHQNGNFKQTSKQIWTETSPDGSKLTFQETGRDDWSVYMIDRSRDITIQLDLHTKKIYIYYERPNRRVLYSISNASSARVRNTSVTNGKNVNYVQYPKGNFKKTNRQTWIETSPDGSKLTFKETGRDEWSVYMIDRSRDITIQLDLHTKKIYIYYERPNRRILYKIIKATSVR